MLKLNTLSGFGSGAAAAGGAVPIYGYAGGGNSSGYGGETDRITFATSTTAAHTDADLSNTRGSMPSGISDTTTYGYYSGGYSSSASSSTDRLTFATSTTAAHTDADMPTARYYLFGDSDGTTYGYITGGNNSVISDRLTFATSTTAAYTDGDLTWETQGALYNNDYNGTTATYGYFAGGKGGDSPYDITHDSTQRRTYSTGAIAAHTDADLSVNTVYGGGWNDNTGTYGYFCGGGHWTPETCIDTGNRITFSTAVTAAHTDSNLATAVFGVGCVNDGAAYGYNIGGGDTDSYDTDVTQRLTYSTGVFAVHTDANAVAAATQLCCGISDGWT